MLWLSIFLSKLLPGVSFFRKIPLANKEMLCYNMRAKTQGCSSAGRVAVSKTVGRGFESFRPCHERNLFCLPRQKRFFHAFRGKIALNIGKYLQNRGWNGHRGRTNPCFWLFGGEISVLLFAFLYRAKKLAKQHPTGFEYRKPQRCRGKVTAKPCKSTGFVL